MFCGYIIIEIRIIINICIIFTYMKEALSKIIESFILPRFGWIVDYKISLYLNAPLEKYTVTYYVEPDEDGMLEVREEMDEVDNLTENFFKMMGPNGNQVLSEVFYVVKK